VTNTGRPTKPGALDRGSIGGEPPVPGDADRHVWYDDVRVGLARGTDTVDEVPGDADVISWTVA
jgi:hypothetical protein